VNAIIFITALSEFDQVLIEDAKINRMVESLHLFDDICNNPFFLTTAIILFLNKKDLFSEKIRHSTIVSAFPDYSGGNSYAEQVDYIKRAFLSVQVRTYPDTKTIYVHETCATDTKQVQVVIDSTVDTVMQAQIQKLGI